MSGSIVRENFACMILGTVITYQQTNFHTLLRKDAVDLFLQEALPIVSGHEDQDNWFHYFTFLPFYLFHQLLLDKPAKELPVFPFYHHIDY